MGVPLPGVQFFMPSNLGGIADGADPDWQLKQQRVDQGDAFKNGLPTDAAGNPDYNAMAKAMFQKGAFEPATALLGVGIQQKQLADASKLTAGMTRWLSPDGGDAQPTSTPSPSGDAMPIFRAAISGIESGGKYDAQGPVTKSGDRAYGKYQVMGQNIGPWTKEVLGTEMSPDQFLADPKVQDAVFDGKFGQYLKQTGNPQDASSMWFTGKPYAQGAGAQDQLGTTGAGYVQKFMTALRSGDAARSLRGQSQNSEASSDSQPTQVAQNGDSDAPTLLGRHPYAPTPPATPDAGSQSTPVMTSAQSQQSAPAPDASSQPAPMPQSLMPPPPPSPNSGSVTHPDDRTFGGQVPQAWLNAGHSAADWVRYARGMAALGSGNKFAEGAALQWSKLADGLQTSIEKQNELTTQQKDARDPLVIKNQADLATLKATARANAMTDTAERRAEQTQEGQALGKIPAQLATAADSARNQNEMIDAMVDAGRQFNMGKFAPAEQAFNATVSALGHKIGVDTSEIDGKTAAYQVYTKILGQFTRTAMKEAGSRTGGIQEMQFVSGTLPSPTTSPDGLTAIANQMKGINDFAVAKQAAGEAWLDKTGTMRGFDTTWNKQVSPAAFVMHRLQVDQPQVFSQTVNRLAQSAQGRAALQHMRSGMAWAGNAGLLD